MTTNTEPLKVGEECREAFEQWYRSEVDRYATFGWDAQGYYYNARINPRWETWQAAWNRRTESSPAEVEPATGEDLAIYNRIAANYQAARVEGGE